MGLSTREKFERHLEKNRLSALARIAELAEQYRSSVLLPLCREHGFTYSTCNGNCWFTNREGDSYFHDFDVENHDAFLKPAFEILDLPDHLGGVFGYHVKDITKDDLESTKARRRK